MGLDEAHESRHWKVKKPDGSQLEPANLQVLRQWVSSHQIGPDDLVINEDLADWIRASEVLELFDLFDKQAVSLPPGGPGHPPKETKEPPGAPVEVEVPDCAYHAGRKATEICVGCGKFICEECRERIEGKVYCRRCGAEKQAGVEPGAPVGPRAEAQIISTGTSKPRTSGIAIASAVIACISVAAAVLLILPNYRVPVAPAAAFIAFVAVLSGAVALNRIRAGGGALRGRPFALSGLIAGCIVLSVSLVSVAFFSGRPRPAQQAGSGQFTGLEQVIPSRRGGSVSQPARGQAPPELTEQLREEREATAQQLLTEVEKHLAEDRLEQAISTARTILGLYPDTETAKLVQERLPALEQALELRRAEAEEMRRQNEALSQQRFEHAMKMYSEDNRATALDLLKSIVENYPDTKAAEQAGAEIAKIERAVADQEMKRLDELASELAAQAEQKMEAEQYADAAGLYREILSKYSTTPTASAAQSRLQEAELLARDPAEREFRTIQKALEAGTYEELIALLQEFLAEYPESDRTEEAATLLAESERKKKVADSLYQFGHAYFEEGKYNLAVGRYEKLINEHPKSQWISQAEQEYDEALRMLQE
ncbi:MAG: hypothetical protein C4532_03140 [Candidatus Abyssobacteria bacterium SURF_17]|uniref:GYF domain-containing protein n=1 Tax=Candidatus Abyssobacteria bacterium SURF_17 TaxID=2093361 RepID=A0A419F6P0_9BACT|nr:MAG: hypothetical protein C4532_03140 [Candidatus Abyssubacteria bacterium SURF_17]